MPGCDLNIWWASCTSARHAGSFDCLMTSLILITMNNGRGHCAYWQYCKVPNQTHRGMKKARKMYAIKQIKICAEYRDMLPRPRLDLSGTPGLRPIGFSPGSWQTSLAQVLICITHEAPIPAFICIYECLVYWRLYPSLNLGRSWWRHQMETFSALLALCAGYSPVSGEFPSERPVTRSFDVFFDLRLNKRLSEQSWGWWFETLSRPLWRHCNAIKPSCFLSAVCDIRYYVNFTN